MLGVTRRGLPVPRSASAPRRPRVLARSSPAADAADVVAVAAQDPARRPAGSLGPASPPHRRKRAAAMIKGIIIVNNNGQARICKFFQSVHEEGYSAEDAQQQVVRKVFQQVAQRPDSFCNYLEGSIPEWGATTKLIYRHYATLYFVFAVDELESDLGILDLIQVFVEALDKCFENVCELDLIFHSDKVHYILDEIVMAGMVLETNIVSILQGVNDQNKLHQKSLSKLNEALGVTGKAQAR
jgi:AP-3 complex subunit sigma